MNIDSLFDLSGKVAIVTGGGDGIGKGSCETLAHFGASIVVSDLVLEKPRLLQMKSLRMEVKRLL